MFGKFYSKLASFALKRADLSVKDYTNLSRLVLDKSLGLPFKDIIVVDEMGVVWLEDKILDREMRILLQESAKNALNNQARKIIRDQVAFNAIKVGVHSAVTNEQMYFARAAIWWGQQEDILLKTLANGTQE